MTKTILILISFFNSILSIYSLGNACISNLDCLDSACCRNNICVTNDICMVDMRNIYIAIGIVGFSFLVATLIYFIISIRTTRENVRKIKHKLVSGESN